MLHKKIFLILTLLAASLLAVPAFAVVNGPGEDCPKKKKTAEDSLDIYEEENKVQDDFMLPARQPQTRKPLAKQAAKKPLPTVFDKSQAESPDVQEEEDPNSAMSFNFIYYIIDKFKFTDPLE